MTTFTARTDCALVRANARSTRYVLLQATAPERRTRKAPTRPPVNVAFVLDRSGSMAGTKLALAKYAVESGQPRRRRPDRTRSVRCRPARVGHRHQHLRR